MGFLIGWFRRLFRQLPRGSDFRVARAIFSRGWTRALSGCVRVYRRLLETGAICVVTRDGPDGPVVLSTAVHITGDVVQSVVARPVVSPETLHAHQARVRATLAPMFETRRLLAALRAAARVITGAGAVSMLVGLASTSDWVALVLWVLGPAIVVAIAQLAVRWRLRQLHDWLQRAISGTG